MTEDKALVLIERNFFKLFQAATKQNWMKKGESKISELDIFDWNENVTRGLG